MTMSDGKLNLYRIHRTDPSHQICGSTVSRHFIFSSSSLNSSTYDLWILKPWQFSFNFITPREFHDVCVCVLVQSNQHTYINTIVNYCSDNASSRSRVASNWSWWYEEQQHSCSLITITITITITIIIIITIIISWWMHSSIAIQCFGSRFGLWFVYRCA